MVCQVNSLTKRWLNVLDEQGPMIPVGVTVLAHQIRPYRNQERHDVSPEDYLVPHYNYPQSTGKDLAARPTRRHLQGLNKYWLSNISSSNWLEGFHDNHANVLPNSPRSSHLRSCMGHRQHTKHGHIGYDRSEIACMKMWNNFHPGKNSPLNICLRNHTRRTAWCSLPLALFAPVPPRARLCLWTGCIISRSQSNHLKLDSTVNLIPDTHEPALRPKKIMHAYALFESNRLGSWQWQRKRSKSQRTLVLNHQKKTSASRCLNCLQDTIA